MFALFVSACGGGGDNPVQPEKEQVRVFVDKVPAQVKQARSTFPLTPVPVTASAVSTLGNPVTVSCTVDGSSVPCDADAMLMPGTHNVCATAKSTTGVEADAPACKQTIVSKLTMTGRVAVVNSVGEISFPAGVLVTLGPEGAQDSTVTGANGSYTFNSKYIGMDNVPMYIPSDGARFPWFGRTSSEFWARPNPVIGPMFVQTPVCATAGPSRRVAIDLEEAYQPPLIYKSAVNPAIPFLRRRNNDFSVTEDAVRGPQVYQVGSWKWPVKVAFDSIISPADSVKFWSLADSINRTFCTKVIVPAQLSELGANFYDGIRASFRKPTPERFASGGTSSYYGDFILGGVEFPHDLSTVPQGTFFHEFGHALGALGHKDVQSMMAPGPVLTDTDIALFLLQQWVRAGERANNSRFSLAQMHQGWRVSHGLEEHGVYYLGEDGKTGSFSVPGGPMSIIGN